LTISLEATLCFIVERMIDKMKNTSRVAVCSRSFSAHSVLREELMNKYSEVKFNDSGKSLSGSELIQFLRGNEKAIVALEKIDSQLLKELPELKVVGKYGVGLDNLDFKAMDEFQVQLGWTAGVNAPSVAECTLGMALNIVRNLHIANDLVKSKGWKQITGKQLSSLTFGVLGCGHVGKAVVKLLKPFGCQILAHDILDFKSFYQEHGAQAVSFEYLLKNSDVLSLHIPRNQKTLNLMNEQNLSMMKPGSFLINTARGGLVDEAHLLKMLNSGHLAAAALDVFAEEPPQNFELLQHPKLFATTHLGGSSEEAILAMGRSAILGLENFRRAGDYEQ
jgi:phosphoglycerate dehydrogenase-like enzyme